MSTHFNCTIIVVLSSPGIHTSILNTDVHISTRFVIFDRTLLYVDTVVFLDLQLINHIRPSDYITVRVREYLWPLLGGTIQRDLVLKKSVVLYAVVVSRLVCLVFIC